jgi:sterol desaturase/sphingolipid hydroxylase (fatty acid hydroxylase superfamily)
MHKWNTKRIPDVGAWLYRHVHSLHHKSKNPTSWSGISMHPVEGALYYTAALIPVCFGACPLTFWFCKMDLTVGALIGHDGFGFPATVRCLDWDSGQTASPWHHPSMHFSAWVSRAPFQYAVLDAPSAGIP